MKKNAEKKFLNGCVFGCVKLNMRKKPDINSEVLTILDFGDKLKIDENKNKNDWFYVIYNDMNGYCMKNFIKVLEE